MTYQIVAHPRSGATYVHVMNEKRYKESSYVKVLYGEFLYQKYYMVSQNEFKYELGNTYKNNVKSKLDFLERKRKENIHFSIKLIPSTIDTIFHKDVLQYLSHYKILTVKRNPFDAFLSYQYQQKTNWKKTHGMTKSLIDKIEILSRNIDSYLNIWVINYNFINSCQIYHTFNYDNLHNEVKDFFSVDDCNINIKPMEINYRSLLTYDPQIVEEMFYDRYETKMANAE